MITEEQRLKAKQRLKQQQEFIKTQRWQKSGVLQQPATGREKYFEVGKEYPFVPSGDASRLRLLITGLGTYSDAVRWFRKTYNRSFEGQEFDPPYFLARVVISGRDADIYHRKGSIYYVSNSEFYKTEM